MKEQPVSIEIFTSQPISFAMSYVPFQKWNSQYEPDTGFSRGTLFPCLDKPFIGEEAINHDR